VFLLAMKHGCTEALFPQYQPMSLQLPGFRMT
jgi:hypothetical protein